MEEEIFLEGLIERKSDSIKICDKKSQNLKNPINK